MWQILKLSNILSLVGLEIGHVYWKQAWKCDPHFSQTAHLAGCMLKPWINVQWLFQLLSRKNSCLTQTPPHLAYAWSSRTVAHTNPAEASTPSLQTIHLSQSSPASPSPTPLSTANANSFKTIHIFLLQTHCIKEPPQPKEGFFVWCSCCWWFGMLAPGPGPLSG